MANNISGASLNPIYQRLHDAPQYHPLEADTFADWSMEAGDIVTVSRDGKSYESPVHSSTVTWKKGQQVTVSSTGQEKRDSVTKMSQKKYNRGNSGLRNSENRYQQIVTSYNEMTSGLILASSSAALYVNNKYTQMQSGLFLTESSAHLYTNNKYSQMQSGLKLTESSAHLYTNNKYTQMSSGLKLSESSARLYVDSKYNQMQSGLEVTMSSATLYAKNRTTRAYIVARINADGEGEALIEADKIILNGDVTLGGIMSVGSGSNIYLEGNILARMTGSAGGGISANALVVNNNGYMHWGGYDFNIYGSDISVMIKTVSVSNNTLTLTRWDGTSVNFSKATWMTGEWDSSGKLTVRAKQHNGSTDTEVATLYRTLSSGTRSWDGNTCSVPIRAYYGATPPTYEDTGCTITVDATARYKAGFDAVTGDDITLQGNGTSPQSSKPNIAATWETLTSGKKKVSAYIWAKHTDGKWYKLRAFSFTEP